jgi:hypothetical protein
MASLTCPNCGRDNPDFLDDCQFCQTALRREATLNIGENPTKKSTGELEGVLPDWLRDARQQARDSAEEEAAKEAGKPKTQKEDPLDLLAGLAFQTTSDEEEVPDWLSAMNPEQEKKTPASSKPATADEDQSSDFFAQFEQTNQRLIDTSPTIPLTDETAPVESLPWTSGSTDETQRDELTDWFSQTSAQSSDPFAIDAGGTPPSGMDNFNAISQDPFDLTQDKSVTSAQPEDLGWLHELEASAKDEPSVPSAPQADAGWMSNLDSPSGTQEDLSWLNNLGGMPAPSSAPELQPEDLSWLSNLGGTPLPSEPAAQPSSNEDDLDWLNNLGGQPLTSESTPSQGLPPEEDLSWLNTLGGKAPAPAEPPQEDLSWLNNLNGTPLESQSTQPSQSADDRGWHNNISNTPAPVPSEPGSTQQDLDWLDALSGTPSSESSPVQPASSSDDLTWLNSLGGTPAPTPAEPSTPQDDLSWLDTLGSPPAAPSTEPATFTEPEVPDWLKSMEAQQSPESSQASQFSPRNTAPLSEDARQEMPDWLKSATEASKSTSLPPLGATWPASEKPVEKRKVDEASSRPKGLLTPDQTWNEPVADTGQGVPVDDNAFSTPSDSTLANQDVDALFAVDLPDWLSQPAPGDDETSISQAGDIPAGVGDELSPVDLPSWVQAMRPVEAVISEASVVSAGQTTEREGPLVGLSGVLPFAPIGSAQRPKAISLKLQATAEQQAGALLVEQIIANEAKAQPLKVSPFVASQRALRWVLTGLFLLILGSIVALGSRFMPISAGLPPDVNNAISTIMAMPESAHVLVVMDYEPSLTGEMEAIAGPLLDQMVVLRRPIFTFISTSPNGTGLVDRLLINTKITQPTPDGLGYQLDTQYFNAGYLPAGLAGVRGFTEQPKAILPALTIDQFSDFAAVIVITDHAESGQIWIEQVSLAKQLDPFLANQQLLVVASAQAGPMLRPYTSSKQVAGMISGIADAARYEFVNNSRPGIVRSYWDAFGAGLFLAVISMVLGSLWSLFGGMRARRSEKEPG